MQPVLQHHQQNPFGQGAAVDLVHLVFDTHQQHAAGEQQRHERRILQHNPQQAGRDRLPDRG